MFNYNGLENKLKGMDFLLDADNVYRTNAYIVKQKISISVKTGGTSILMSDDTYYLRTSKRDKDYELAFKYKDHINGKRMRSASYIRKYIH